MLKKRFSIKWGVTEKTRGPLKRSLSNVPLSPTPAIEFLGRGLENTAPLEAANTHVSYQKRASLKLDIDYDMEEMVSYRLPERNLLTAVLEQAIRDALGPAQYSPKSAASVCPRLDALYWLLEIGSYEEDKDGLRAFSFTWTCDVLEIAYSYRRDIQKMSGEALTEYREILDKRGYGNFSPINITPRVNFRTRG